MQFEFSWRESFWLEDDDQKNIEQIQMIYSENTHLLLKRKYHCTVDLLFDWFGLDQAG